MKKSLFLLAPLFVLCACGTIVNPSQYGFNKENSDKTGDVYYNFPKNSKYQQLSLSTKDNLIKTTLSDFDSYLSDSDNKDYVISPASYALAISGLSAVSTGINNAAFGLSSSPSNDVKSLLNSWNFEVKKEGSENSSAEYNYFRSAVLHQQVGGTYKFDNAKRQSVADKYISTLVSPLASAKNQAQDFFKDKIGLSLNIPGEATQDGVVTYGALKMKDYVPGGLSSSNDSFNYQDGTKATIPVMPFGSVQYPKELKYAKGSNFEVFQIKIEHTSMIIVLPNKDVAIEDVSVSNAYSLFKEQGKVEETMGYVPFFHVKSENVNLTKIVKSKLNGSETLCSGLLQSSVVNDLQIESVLQASDFEFNRYGVCGESITAVYMCGSSAPEEHDPIILNVDRPFYAISVMDDFPLFISKVNNPNR